MRHVSWLLILLLLTAILLVGCTEDDREQTTNPAQTTVSQIDSTAEQMPVESGGEPVSNTIAPIPTELETQGDLVIDVTGQPVIGG